MNKLEKTKKGWEYYPHWISKGYERVQVKKFLKLCIENVSKELIERLPAGKVVDYGSGPGSIPITLAKNCPYAEIIGVDKSTAMIQIAKENVQREKLEQRIQFIPTNGRGIPLEKDSVDFIYSNFSLFVWNDPYSIINDMYRVLKPGTEAWIYDGRKEFSMNASSKIYGFHPSALLGRFYLWFIERFIEFYSMEEATTLARNSLFGKNFTIESRDFQHFPMFVIKLKKVSQDS